jgi:hypothetical protein
MTYQEKLKHMIEYPEVRLDDGSTMPALIPGWFMMGISALTAMVARELLRESAADVTTNDGQKLESADAIEDPTALDVVSLIGGDSGWVRYIQLSNSCRDFWFWLMQQEAEDYEDEENDQTVSWYDAKELMRQWNRFAMESRKGENHETV